MTVKFHKYQGTGNDFVMIDNRSYALGKDKLNWIRQICDRRFGVGGDGLIYLQERSGYDFEMVYFNSDGNESSMCGNGGRCLIQFAHDLGLIKDSCTFIAIDGEHEGKILSNGNISLKMKNVESIERYHDDYVLNTGSPHYVRFVPNANAVQFPATPHSIRYNTRFEKEGINVNFVERKAADKIFVRTYERGVEAETLSCGTGVVASALALSVDTNSDLNHVKIETPGGALEVKFQPNGKNGFKDVFLIGPAVHVFDGTLDL